MHDRESPAERGLQPAPSLLVSSPLPLLSVSLSIHIYSLSQLRLLLHGANLQLGPVLLQHAVVVVLPELLGGVLAGDALEDLGAARVLVCEF